MLEFGKTIFISILARLIKIKKILIIDFDLKNKSMRSVFGVKQIKRDLKEKLKDDEYLREFRLKEKNIEKLKIEIDKNLHLISNTDIVFDDKYKFDKSGINEMLELLNVNYNLILIDTSSDTKYDEVTKLLANLSDKIICLVEGNLINLKKTFRLLNSYENEKNKINLVYNKKNRYCLSLNFMKLIFFKYKKIGYLSYYNRYNKIINKNVNKSVIGKNIRDEFKKIIDKLQIK